MPSVFRVCVSALVLLLGLSLAGCGVELGDAPFLCNPGQPRCPDGYECNPGNVCVRAGSCPEGVRGCATAAPHCGDGKCDAASETCSSCPKDCGICGVVPGGCGNGNCDANETCSTCEKDCGKCPPTTSCGNGTCDVGESCSSCEKDCGKCPTATCGNGKCDPGESCSSCEKDCGKCPGPVCGNGTCEAGETSTTCPKDCPPPTGCTNGTTKCDSKDALRYCEASTWKTSDCKTLCTQGGFAFAVECRLDSTKNKDVCVCGNPGKFGDPCTVKEPCESSLFCGGFSTSGAGFCTKSCTTANAVCSGAPFAAEARCIHDMGGGKRACGFLCDLLFPSCPGVMKCDWLSGVCGP